MRALLIRVGVDSGPDGGTWNAPVRSADRTFAYVPIPEAQHVTSGAETPYSLFAGAVAAFGVSIPSSLITRNAHLDPDFEHLMYGDRRERGRQILNKLGAGDLIVFYAALQDIAVRRPLVYALIGLYVVDNIVYAQDVRPARHHENAHTRRQKVDDTEIIVRARPGMSGRLERCIPFGDREDGIYRIKPRIERAWGGIQPGYIQRTARLPEIGEPRRFLRWFESHDPVLIWRNN